MPGEAAGQAAHRPPGSTIVCQSSKLEASGRLVAWRCSQIAINLLERRARLGARHRQARKRRSLHNERHIADRVQGKPAHGLHGARHCRRECRGRYREDPRRQLRPGAAVRPHRRVDGRMADRRDPLGACRRRPGDGGDAFPDAHARRGRHRQKPLPSATSRGAGWPMSWSSAVMPGEITCPTPFIW